MTDPNTTRVRAASGEAATGLPWPRTWRGVYCLVLGCFAAYVALLYGLTRAFSG